MTGYVIHYHFCDICICVVGNTCISIMASNNFKIGKTKKSNYGYDTATKWTHVYSARQERTDYAATLVDPNLEINCRIPDLACYPTCTFKSEYHQPIVIDAGATSTNNQVFYVGLHTLPTVTMYQGTKSAVVGGPGSISTNTGKNFSIGDSGANTRYKAARLVSAMARLSFAGKDTETEGSIQAAFLPKRYATTCNNLGAVTFYSATTVDQVPDYYSGPLRNGAVVRYKPTDADSFNMATVALSTSATTDPDYFGSFVFIVNPGAASTTMQLDIVMNWEGIPLKNNVGVEVAVSGADPGALAHGLNSASMSATCFSNTSSSWNKNVDSVLRSVA